MRHIQGSQMSRSLAWLMATLNQRPFTAMDETRNKVTILSSLPVPVQVPSPQPLRMSLALPDQAEVPTVRFFFEPLFDSEFFF